MANVIGELEKAKRELEGKTGEESEKSGLLKSINDKVDNMMSFLFKSRKKKEDPPPEEEDDEALPEDEMPEDEDGDEEGGRKSLSSEIYEDLLKSGEFEEVVEASPALQHLSDVMAKSMEGFDCRLSSLEEMMKAGLETIAVMAKSQASILGDIDLVKSNLPPTNPGILFSQKRKETGELNKSQVRIRLNEMLRKGEISSAIMQNFDSQGIEGLPQDLRKSLMS